MTQYTLAVDIGGTFTDIVLLDHDTLQLAVAKVLTTYPDPSQAVLIGVRDLLNVRNVSAHKISRVIHGTTLVTNTLIERKGAATALITTQGFRDALEIGREGRYDIYDLFLRQPQPLVERRLRLEASERMDAQGNVLIGLDEESVRQLCTQLRSEKVEALAVTFLHSYANPKHELRVADLVRELLPTVAISLSHQVAPELREYERTSTTVANAYVQPLTAHYLRRLQEGLVLAGVDAPLHIMLSNGGTCGVETAAAFPVRLVESGPSGGALAGVYWGQAAGYTHVLAFDMGGTTAKAILAHDGELAITNRAEVARIHRFRRGSGLPLLVPMLDMIEIGAGGGSIAHLNELKLPAVGPESAGSTPGPACYAQGGSAPTVTDADLLLGYLNPDYFVGGDMVLDGAKARAAFTGLANQFAMTVERMAWGIHQLVNENMAGAARVHAAERGLDIRSYAMVATGGAGPVHVCGVAQRLGIKTVIIPPVAGVGSAFGMLLAPIAFDFTRSHVARLTALDITHANALLAEMQAEGERIVAEAGVAQEELIVTRTVDMRYVGQGFEIRVPVPTGVLDSGAIAQIGVAFDAEYTRIYGRLCDGVPTEVINWRVVVSGPRPMVTGVSLHQSTGGKAPQKGTRWTLFDPDIGPVETPIYDRYALPRNFAAHGPAIVEETESTTVVPPGWLVKVDKSGSLIVVTAERA